MQASLAWNPPTGTLGAIVAEAHARVALLKAIESSLENAAADALTVPSFSLALRSATVGIIAEAKRRAPSKGWINAAMSAADQARAYERGGAAAISVLTEPAHFSGSSDDLTAVRTAVGIPTLKKDFHIDPVQLLEAKALGASAALVIVRALSPDGLKRMADAARALGLEILFEVRDGDELQQALDVGATIIGINNRNLETLIIDPGNAERLLPLVPSSAIGIAESGVSTKGDVACVARVGADAVLVGSAISSADDPTAAVQGLSGVARVSRGH